MSRKKKPPLEVVGKKKHIVLPTDATRDDRPPVNLQNQRMLYAKMAVARKNMEKGYEEFMRGQQSAWEAEGFRHRPSIRPKKYKDDEHGT